MGIQAVRFAAAPLCDRDDPNVGYAADDAETCAGISIQCQPDWKNFENECGCGCGCGCENIGMTSDDPQFRAGWVGGTPLW